MIPTLSFVTCGITLFVSLVLPVLVMIVLSRKWKLNHIPSAWFLGALGFFIPQMLIRTRMLNGFAANPGFQSFAENHYILYSLILAFTAGAFELAGRYGVAKVLKRDMTFRRSLAAGLGHGGIEAMILIGATYINNLIYMVMIQTGSFGAVIAQAAGAGVDASQLYAIQDALVSTSPWMFLLAGYERILTMVLHTAMSMLVCYGVVRKKTLVCCLMCLVFHTALDLSAGISALAGTVLSQVTAYTIVYTMLTAVALLSLYVIRELCRRWNETEVPHDQ